MSGSARRKGCTACGKRSTEKKTPEPTNIGIMIRFIRPLTVSILRGRLATARPMPAKLAAPSSATAITDTKEPRTGTPSASQAKPSRKPTSTTVKTSRVAICAARKSAARIGVASSRRSSFLIRMSTSA